MTIVLFYCVEDMCLKTDPLQMERVSANLALGPLKSISRYSTSSLGSLSFSFRQSQIRGLIFFQPDPVPDVSTLELYPSHQM